MRRHHGGYGALRRLLPWRSRGNNRRLSRESRLGELDGRRKLMKRKYQANLERWRKCTDGGLGECKVKQSILYEWIYTIAQHGSSERVSCKSAVLFRNQTNTILAIMAQANPFSTSTRTLFPFLFFKGLHYTNSISFQPRPAILSIVNPQTLIRLRQVNEPRKTCQVPWG